MTELFPPPSFTAPAGSGVSSKFRFLLYSSRPMTVIREQFSERDVHPPPRRGGEARQLNRSLARRGGAKREPDRRSLNRRPRKRLLRSTTPSAPLRWLRGIFNGAATPPLRGGEFTSIIAGMGRL